MLDKNVKCPRCKGDKNTEFLLLNDKQNCFTCNGENYISDEHEKLLELGFIEDLNLRDSYRLTLHKKVNSAENFDFLIKRIEGKLISIETSIFSPYANEYLKKLNNVDEIISFVRKLS